MPDRTPVQNTLQLLFRRLPWLQTGSLRVLDLWYQLALLPYRRRRRAGSSAENPELTTRTDAYNAAAERYFARFETPSFLLDKPFSEPAALPKHLIDAGVLIAALRAAPGDVVLELGAGSCWLSHMLNRYGCPTIAVDVSPTVVDLGRRLFQADSRTNWDLAPRFLVYDGHRLPVDDSSCDRIVVNDAFHHVPNQRELLGEMHRVLRDDGIVAMSEPGRGHARAAHSIHEAREFGVLENELVIEDVVALAGACGFDDARVIVSSPHVQMAIDAADLGAFMGGKGFATYWKSFCSALEEHHYILLVKGQAGPTTKRPARVSASVEVAVAVPESHVAGTEVPITLRIANTGDTLWLGGDTPRAGWTRVGAHLYKRGAERALIDYDWWRAHLPPRVGPGEQVTLGATLPPLTVPGQYVVVFDLVIEGMTWFATQGSPPLAVDIRIR